MKKIEIKRILVPVDFSGISEIAMNEAIKLAKLLKADVFLIHVLEFTWNYFSVVPETQKLFPSDSELLLAVEKRMEDMKAKVRKKFGIVASIFITTGPIYSEILSYAEKKKIDLIIMGTHGASGYKELFIGTNAQRVVTLSEIPVLTMQNNYNKLRFCNILIPIDNTQHSREKINLAMIIANLFDSKIHVIGLNDSDDEQELNKFKIKLESVEKIIQADKLQYKTTIIHGNNLADEAINYATKNKCDLILINTGHESQLTGIFLGALAQQIVNHSKIPVLSIKHAHGYYSIETPGIAIS